MNKLIQILTLCFLSISANAQLTEAKPVKDLLSAIKSTQFRYTETGMAFGYVGIRSCVYTSEQMIVIKNYCFPKKEYVAKGYTIISAKFGLIKFYQEDLVEAVLKRDIAIDSFPEYVRPLLKDDLRKMKLPQINSILESLYHNGGPGCWSTNHSFYTQSADVNCYQEDIAHFPDWAAETQAILSDKNQWQKIIREMASIFPKILTTE